MLCFFFSSRRRHTRFDCDWSSDVCSSDLDTPFGLSGAVHTADTERGVRVAQRIETGMMHVNDGTIADEPIVAFGGEKHSGVGRLGSESTIETFTTLKWISIQHGRSLFPF